MSSLLTSTLNSRYISKSKGQSLLIRSDKIEDCLENEIQFLYKKGIRTVIDLRDLSNKKINPFLEKHDMKLINCSMPITQDKEEFYKLYPNGHTFDYYVFLITKYSRIKKLLEVIESSDGGVLINCSAGRDRTGVVSFIIELLAGFDKEDICEDFAVSDLNLIDASINRGFQLASNLNYVKAKDRAYKLYGWFEETFGSIENYINIVFGNSYSFYRLKHKIDNICN